MIKWIGKIQDTNEKYIDLLKGKKAAGALTMHFLWEYNVMYLSLLAKNNISKSFEILTKSLLLLLFQNLKHLYQLFW